MLEPRIITMEAVEAEAAAVVDLPTEVTETKLSTEPTPVTKEPSSGTLTTQLDTTEPLLYNPDLIFCFE